MDKIAISSVGPTLDDPMDARFGRAAGFIILDPETEAFTYLDNGACQTMAQGAGNQAAENVVEAGATVVLTGFVGPKAFRALSAGGVRIGHELEGMTVREAVARYAAGQVELAEEASGRPHGS